MDDDKLIKITTAAAIAANTHRRAYCMSCTKVIKLCMDINPTCNDSVK